MEGQREYLGLLQIGKFEKGFNLSAYVRACDFQKASLEENERKKYRYMTTEGSEGSEVYLAR